jgi:hypothetical protein
MRKPTIQVPLTVHALFQGFPLCRFTTQVPAKWPEGHRWVYPSDEGLINCQGCKDALPLIDLVDRGGSE